MSKISIELPNSLFIKLSSDLIIDIIDWVTSHFTSYEVKNLENNIQFTGEAPKFSELGTYITDGYTLHKL
jgi:uncharacterized protein (DUF488 family)